MLNLLIKKAKWVAWAVVAAVAVILPLVLRRLFTSPTDNEWQTPPVPTSIQNQVAQAQEDAQVAEAQAKAKADTQQTQLKQILTVSDAVERRKQLATFLQGLN